MWQVSAQPQRESTALHVAVIACFLAKRDLLNGGGIQLYSRMHQLSDAIEVVIAIRSQISVGPARAGARG